jgi:sporulation protein YqfD
MVSLEFTAADLPQAIQQLNQEGVELFDFQQMDYLTGQFRIKRKDYPQLVAASEQYGCKVRPLEKYGLYWSLAAVLRRPILLLGFLAVLFLILWLPSRVLFVQVEGNIRIPTKQILAAAEDCGICFGASRQHVRSEKVKNALMTSVPQLQWAGVNTSGCVASISVRERTEETESAVLGGIGSIVAARDGYVLSASATKGSLKVHSGQTVQEGQVLISGYTDCGISIRAEQAEGEIYAQTQRNISAVMPAIARHKVYTGEEKKKISLLIGKKRINLWKNSGIPLTGCGRMYEEYYITLPGGFRLPVAVCLERFSLYEEVPSSGSDPHQEADLAAYAAFYLTRQMSAGQILREKTEITQADGVIFLEAAYECREMIGRVRLEQIGEANG